MEWCLPIKQRKFIWSARQMEMIRYQYCGDAMARSWWRSQEGPPLLWSGRYSTSLPSFQSLKLTKVIAEDTNVKLLIRLESHFTTSTCKSGVIKLLFVNLKHLKFNSSISEPPGSPDNLTVLSVNSRTARVSWAISRAEPKIERFVVQWKKQHGNTSYSSSITNYMNCLEEI